MDNPFIAITTTFSSGRPLCRPRASVNSPHRTLDLDVFQAVPAGRAGECVRTGARRAWSRPVANMLGSIRT
jgi:hypothetical protein